MKSKLWIFGTFLVIANIFFEISKPVSAKKHYNVESFPGIIPPPVEPIESPMFLLLNAKVYTPQPIGNADMLIGGGKILAIVNDSSLKIFQNAPNVVTMDLSGLIITPGFIDVHVHVTGGGGESGPASRVPEAHIDELLNGGVTSLIGILGTDSITRSVANLVEKVRALEILGISTWMWTGAYRVPSPTITGDIQKDIILIEPIIGVGEVAISDHRSSIPSFHDLASLVSDARIGGMVGGKPGKAHFHVGAADSMLDPLWEIVNRTPIPITQMYPTHISSRGQNLIEEGKKWISAGGFLDFTADPPGENETLGAILEYYYDGIDLTHITLSSDSYGSDPTFNENGVLIGYDYGRPNVILLTVQILVRQFQWPLERALQFATSNTADFLGFNNKGRLELNRDADLLVFDSSLNLQYVFAKSQILKTPFWTKTAWFPCV